MVFVVSTSYSRTNPIVNSRRHPMIVTLTKKNALLDAPLLVLDEFR